MKIAEVKYSRAAKAYVPDISRSRLKSVTLDGRAAVIFSDTDLTLALLGLSAFGRPAYRPETAYELVRNVLLYADGQK